MPRSRRWRSWKAVGDPFALMVMRRPPRGWCQRNAASLPHWALKPSGLAVEYVALGRLGKCEQLKRARFARWILQITRVSDRLWALLFICSASKEM